MTILIIAQNQKEKVQRCVDSIRQFCDIANAAVVVIDNNSNDGTKEWLNEQEDLAYAVTDENESVPHIINQTLELFQLQDDLLLLQPQCVITQGCLSSMEQVLDQQQEIGIVEPIVKNNDCQLLNRALLIKRTALDKTGMFDESMEDWNAAIEEYKSRLYKEGFASALTMNAFISDMGEVPDHKAFGEEIWEAGLWDYIFYMPKLNSEKGLPEMVKPIREYSLGLRETGKIKVLFPVAKIGEKPQYSYEEVFLEFSAKGYVFQEVKAISFVSDGENVIGYDLSILKRRKKRLLVLNSKNILIDYNINQIAEAYQSLGWEVIHSTPDANLFKLLQEGIDRFFVINNTGWIAMIGDSTKNVWEQLGIPSINYILDHPMYYDDTLCQAPKNGTLLCVDQNHVQYVKRFYPNINRCLFMPLAGDNSLDGIVKEWKDRDIEVLYLGSYKGSLDRSILSDDGAAILDALLQNRDLTTEAAIEGYLRKAEENVSEEQVKQEIIKQRKVDWYVMTYIRVEVVRALIRGGINVTVYGGGWEAFEYFNDPHFIYKGQTSQAECLEVMKNSKIVLNVMPWFKKGTHDRVINAMLAGAVALTDGSSYMDEAFEKGKEYVEYDLKHLEQLPDIVRNILAGDNAEMRKRAYEKAVTKHRWIQRVEELEKIMTNEEQC